MSLRGVPPPAWTYSWAAVSLGVSLLQCGPTHSHFSGVALSTDTKKYKSQFTVPCHFFVLEKRDDRKKREFLYSLFVRCSFLTMETKCSEIELAHQLQQFFLIYKNSRMVV